MTKGELTHNRIRITYDQIFRERLEIKTEKIDVGIGFFSSFSKSTTLIGPTPTHKTRFIFNLNGVPNKMLTCSYQQLLCNCFQFNDF